MSAAGTSPRLQEPALALVQGGGGEGAGEGGNALPEADPCGSEAAEGRSPPVGGQSSGGSGGKGRSWGQRWAGALPEPGAACPREGEGGPGQSPRSLPRAGGLPAAPGAGRALTSLQRSCRRLIFSASSEVLALELSTVTRGRRAARPPSSPPRRPGARRPLPRAARPAGPCGPPPRRPRSRPAAAGSAASPGGAPAG